VLNTKAKLIKFAFLMRLIFTIIISLSLLSSISFAQPGNDDCINASSLCDSEPLSGTNADATIQVCIGCMDGATVNGNFCFDLNNTVWYTFTTNSTGGDAQLDFSNLNFDQTAGFGSTLEAVIIEAGTACDESTYSAVSNCENNIDNNGGTLNAVGLLPNTTYYIQVDGGMTGADTDPAAASFDMTVSGSAVVQTPPTVTINSSATDV